MKRLFTFVLVVVGLLFAVRYGGDFLLDAYHERSFTTSSEARVNSVLEITMEYGSKPTAPFQNAMCMWYRGVPFISDSAESRRAELGFVSWLQQGKIYNNVESFTIDSVVHESPDDEPRVIVSCTINGRKARIGVRKNLPLEWLK